MEWLDDEEIHQNDSHHADEQLEVTTAEREKTVKMVDGEGGQEDHGQHHQYPNDHLLGHGVCR